MNSKNNKSTKKIKLLIVIVNYFSSKDCLALIKQISQQNVPSLSRIICIDNSCDSGEAQALQELKQFEKVEIQFCESNVGFGAAVNKATKDVIFENLLLINPDVQLTNESIDTILMARNESINVDGIWGGMTVDSNGNPDFFHAWRKPSILRELVWALGLNSIVKLPSMVNHYKFVDFSSNYAVDVVSGCFLLISGDLWKKLKGFDERFFLYSEEVDLCFRASQEGVQPEVIVDATLIHERGGTLTSHSSRLFFMFKSKILFWRKHSHFMNVLFVTFFYIFGSLLRAILFFSFPKRQKVAKSWLSLTVFLLKGCKHNKS